MIQSKDNPIVCEIKKLKEKKYRSIEQRFIVEGFRFVLEALESEFKVPMVFVSEAQRERFNKFQINDRLQDYTKVYWMEDKVFKTLCSTETPQGIAAVVMNRVVDLCTDEGLYVLVDGVQDPGNLGTIIRTADAAGALGIILLKGTVDVYNDKTLRATMGSIFHLPILEVKDFEVINRLIASDFKLVVSSLNGENNFYDENLKGKVIIAVGNEGNGVSHEIQSIANTQVKIPMPGNAESLNVAIASSIMMFEYVRQNEKL